MFKLNTPNVQPPESVGATCCHSNLGLEKTGQQLVETPTRKGQSEMGSKVERIRFTSKKKKRVGGCDEITSSFVATWTNLLPSYSLTHADGGMASIVSESVSDQQPLPHWSPRRRGSESSHDNY